MKTFLSKKILYLIIATAVFTVAIQLYRNIQNYSLNKEQFIKEIQQSLDLGIETYYSQRAKNEVFTLITSDSLAGKANFTTSLKIDNSRSSDSPKTRIWRSMDSLAHGSTNDSIRKGYSYSYSSTEDTLVFGKMRPQNVESIKLFTEDSKDTSKQFIHVNSFAKKIMISLTQENIEFDKLKSFIDDELNRKEILIPYSLSQVVRDSVIDRSDSVEYALQTESKSTYLRRDQSLYMSFPNASLIILRRGLVDIIISLLIIAAVVGSLIFLYRIIQKQKEVSEIKNDLISNITHEFKTPIATISTALEAVTNFNQENDPAKTQKYISIGRSQLEKLNGMVEKLLETATLDSDDLELSLEEVDLGTFTREIVERYLLNAQGKQIQLKISEDVIWKPLDAFHFENALGNLIDNAIKYGGDEIQVKMSMKDNSAIWVVEDNGGGIKLEDKERIFEKFYRVPTGNVHDVKGFGIGLYYTKTIVEKHGGTIRMDSNTHHTQFIITL